MNPAHSKPQVGTLATLAAALLLPALPAHALNFAFRDVGSAPMSAQQLSAFQAAGSYWSSKLSDNATVYLDISFANLPSGLPGGTSSNFTTASYSTVRSALVAGATSALDATAASHLQAAPALTFQAMQGDLSSRLDNDGSSNNTLLGLTTANAKALGLATTTHASNPDASITVGSGFSSIFAYTRAAAVPAGQIDFQTFAEREIGRALGFSSGVDDIDYCAGASGAANCGLPATPGRFEGSWWYQPLDLFRFSAPGLMDVRPGATTYLSVDGGASALESFSSGVLLGNGYPAGSFGPSALNLMRPFIVTGPAGTYDATANDLAALDAIGWDVAAVPEPATYGLMLVGLMAVSRATKRRRG